MSKVDVLQSVADFETDHYPYSKIIHIDNDYDISKKSSCKFEIYIHDNFNMLKVMHRAKFRKPFFEPGY